MTKPKPKPKPEPMRPGWLPLRAIETALTYCVAETSCRAMTVKFYYVPDEMPFTVGEFVGFAHLKTTAIDLLRKYRRQEDIVLDDLKVDKDRNHWLEMPY